mgnify:CR=1 FL=1
MTNRGLVDLAIELSEKLGPVFPCRSNKSPACTNGFQDATCDAEAIKRLFGTSNAELVGLATGQVSGIVVVDLDLAPDGLPSGRSWFKQHRANLPSTYTVQSQSGGRHLYFSSTDRISSSQSKVAPKVDIRADGGYIIAGGPGYKVCKDVGLGQFPEWLKAKLISSQKGLVSTGLSPFSDPLEYRQDGRWYESVRGQVASLIAKGVDREIILDLSPHWTTDGYPHGDTRDQVRKFADSAIAKGFAPRADAETVERVGVDGPLDLFGLPKGGEELSRYVLSDRNDLVKLPKQDWLVKYVMPSKGIATCFGPSGSGKSFLLLDMAAAICLGQPWFGFKTKQTDVIYLCLEGGGGLQKRVLAWEACNKREFPSNFKYVCDDFDLCNSRHVDDLLRVATKGACLIIDTLNRAAPGRDENSSGDMSLLLNAAKRLGESLESLVILVHRTGKDKSKGPRGHSSLHAAFDAELEVMADRKLNTRHWSSSKLKDEEDGKKFGFRLARHHLGYDDDGDAETSCTVKSEALVFQRPEPTGSSQKPAYKAIKQLLKDTSTKGIAGAPYASACIRADSGIDVVKAGLSTVDSSKRNNRAKKIINDLVGNGFLHTGIDSVTDEGWLWLPEE